MKLKNANNPMYERLLDDKEKLVKTVKKHEKYAKVAAIVNGITDPVVLLGGILFTMTMNGEGDELSDNIICAGCELLAKRLIDDGVYKPSEMTEEDLDKAKSFEELYEILAEMLN